MNLKGAVSVWASVWVSEWVDARVSYWKKRKEMEKVEAWMHDVNGNDKM